MTQTIRRTGHGARDELDHVWGRLVSLVMILAFAVKTDHDGDLIRRTNTRILSNPGLADGTTDGKLQNANATDFTVGGQAYSKAATDDLWDLSAETDTIADQFRAYWLYLVAGGTASIAAGANAASEAAAIAALPAEDPAKCPIGVYVAGAATDFNGAAGLAAQGTIINGRPAALAAPGTITISDGGTAGNLQLEHDAAYTIGGQSYAIAPTDDLWDLSAETDTAAGAYRAYWLLLDSAGVASFAASGDVGSEALALAGLPQLDGTKSVVGVYVAGAATDFDDGGGLAAQGTIYVGIPTGAALGAKTKTHDIDTIQTVYA